MIIKYKPVFLILMLLVLSFLVSCDVLMNIVRYEIFSFEVSENPVNPGDTIIITLELRAGKNPYKPVTLDLSTIGGIENQEMELIDGSPNTGRHSTWEYVHTIPSGNSAGILAGFYDVSFRAETTATVEEVYTDTITLEINNIAPEITAFSVNSEDSITIFTADTPFPIQLQLSVSVQDENGHWAENDDFSTPGFVQVEIPAELNGNTSIMNADMTDPTYSGEFTYLHSIPDGSSDGSFDIIFSIADQSGEEDSRTVTININPPISTIEYEFYSFGEPLVGHPSVKDFIITNTGASDLIISDIDVVGDWFSIIAGDSAPLVLPPLHNHRITVQLLVSGSAPYQKPDGMLTITHNDLENFTTLVLVGETPRTQSKIVYEENFDAATAPKYWQKVADWEYGKPTAGPSTVHTGTNCFGTNLDGNYTDHHFWGNNYLQSPSISLAGTTSPELSFYQWFIIEPVPPAGGYGNENNVSYCGDAYDGINLKISIDHGKTWQIVPKTAITTNPYNSENVCNTGQPGWFGTEDDWNEVVVDLSNWAGQTDVMFRWDIYVDWHLIFHGWFIDDVKVSEITLLPEKAQQAANPIPADTSVVHDSDPTFDVNFEWTAAAGAVKFDFYISDEPIFSPTPTYAGITTASQIHNLNSDEKYYWRVDSIDSSDTLITIGQTWTFTATNKASQIELGIPNNLTVYCDRALNYTIPWAAADGATAYDIYFDTNYPPVNLVKHNQVTTGYAASLSPRQTYYLRVNSVNPNGVTWGKVFKINTPTRTPAILINEIYTNSWDGIEIYNSESVIVDISKWQVTFYLNGASRGTFVFPEKTYCYPGQIITIGQNPNTNSKRMADYYTTFSFGWGNNSSKGEIRIRTGTVSGSDEVDYFCFNDSTNKPATGWQGAFLGGTAANFNFYRNSNNDTDSAADWRERRNSATWGIKNSNQ